jgi:hypothetical protein
METTERNRISSKQTEKISKKHFVLGDPQNRYFCFPVRTETNRTQSVSVVFSLLFGKTQKIFFGLF